MKLFASDYDDTLLIDNQISPKDLKVIEEFQAQGNLFGINSGRHLDSIFEECDRFGLRCDFYIGNNGTVVLNKNKEIIHINEFPHELVHEVLNYFRKYLKKEVYFISVNNGYQFGREFFNEGCDFLPTHTDPIDWYLNKPISTMFSQVLDIKKTMPIVNHLNKAFNNKAVFYGNAPFIDIVHEETDKASGLDKLIKIYNIDKNNCYVAGDNYNDISMFKMFNSFVMKDAKDSIKSFADKETESVAAALHQIMSGKF